MIIQIRGTSGSGKSTVVREVMRAMPEMLPWTNFDDYPKRRQPAGYVSNTGFAEGGLAVVGHYQTACGGCDTFSNYAVYFKTATDLQALRTMVLMEGILLSEEVSRTVALAAEHRVIVIELDTPLETCLEGIVQSREAAGNSKPVDPKNTTNRVLTITRSFAKLREAGVAVEKHSRETAAPRILEILRHA